MQFCELQTQCNLVQCNCHTGDETYPVRETQSNTNKQCTNTFYLPLPSGTSIVSFIHTTYEICTVWEWKWEVNKRVDLYWKIGYVWRTSGKWGHEQVYELILIAGWLATVWAGPMEVAEVWKLTPPPLRSLPLIGWQAWLFTPLSPLIGGEVALLTPGSPLIGPPTSTSHLIHTCHTSTK